MKLGNIAREDLLGNVDAEDGWQGVAIEKEPSGVKYIVGGMDEGDLSCDCGDKECGHINVGRDILFGDGTKFGIKHACISGMQKEIRRGNIDRAFMWGVWVSRYWGVDAAIRCLREMCFIDTCNIALMDSLSRFDLVLGEAIRLFCASRKVWEFKEARSGWVANRGAQDRVKRTRMFVSEVADKKAKDLMLMGGAVDQLTLLYASNVYDSENRIKHGQKLRGILINRLVDRKRLTEGQGSRFKQRYEDTTWNNDDFALVMLDSDKMVDGMSGYDMEGDHEIDRVDPYLPYPSNYVMDLSSKRGKKVLTEFEGRTGKNFWFGVDMEDLDYRWDDNPVSAYWRFLAYEQFGKLDVKWEDVVFSEENKKELKAARVEEGVL